MIVLYILIHDYLKYIILIVVYTQEFIVTCRQVRIFCKLVARCRMGIRQRCTVFILLTVSPLQQDIDHYFTHLDCTSTAQALVTDIPLSERLSLGDDPFINLPEFCKWHLR